MITNNNPRYLSLEVKDNRSRHSQRPYIQRQRNYKSVDPQAVANRQNLIIMKSKLNTIIPQQQMLHERTLKQTQRLLQGRQDLQITKKQIKPQQIRDYWMNTVQASHAIVVNDLDDDPNKFFENFYDFVEIYPDGKLLIEFEDQKSQRIESQINNPQDRFSINDNSRNQKSRVQKTSHSIAQIEPETLIIPSSNKQHSILTDLTYSEASIYSVCKKRQMSFKQEDLQSNDIYPVDWSRSQNKFKRKIYNHPQIISRKCVELSKIYQTKDRKQKSNYLKQNSIVVQDANTFRYVCFGKQMKKSGKENSYLN